MGWRKDKSMMISWRTYIMLKRENDQCNVIYTPEDDWFLLSFFLQLAGLLESFGKQNQ